MMPRPQTRHLPRHAPYPHQRTAGRIRSPARQRKPEVWAALADGQRERLEAVGLTRSLRPVETDVPAQPSTAPASAF
ncbi:hypothetical protein [Streptomyces sp. BA2]|uniref:hypothetical protein n=1 Tax=Streptomyces sp. BA2 TaxID=436595 RepID=UPI00132723A3|nr:hypothetical protein [Streptomyces sp. BA2]